MSLGALVPTGPNLVVNGGFEDHASCPDDYWCYLYDNSFMAPWYMAKGSTEYELDITVWPAAEGRVSMDLSPSCPVSVGQDILTVPGKAYRITFQLNQNPCGDIANHTGTLEVTGAPVYNFWHQVPEKNGWTSECYEFTATSNCTTVIFSSTTDNSCGPVIDDVKMFLLAAAETTTSTTLAPPTPTQSLDDPSVTSSTTSEAPITTSTTEVPPTTTQAPPTTEVPPTSSSTTQLTQSLDDPVVTSSTTSAAPITSTSTTSCTSTTTTSTSSCSTTTTTAPSTTIVPPVASSSSASTAPSNTPIASPSPTETNNLVDPTPSNILSSAKPLHVSSWTHMSTSLMGLMGIFMYLVL